MRLEVDHDICEANGVCEDLAPDLFHLREDDVLEITQPVLPADREAVAHEAVDRCPRLALRIVKD